MGKKVDVKKLKFKKFGRNKGGKRNFAFVPPKPERRRRETFERFPNLGLEVEWVDGKVIIRRNGKTEVYNNFNELRVPSRKGVRRKDDPQAKPNAKYFERNGVKYYIFKNIGVAVRSCVSYWPEDSETHPAEHLFGPASEHEIEEVLKADEERWKKRLQRAVDRAIRAAAKQYGVELPPKDVLVSPGLIEELQERGFDVKIKA